MIIPGATPQVDPNSPPADPMLAGPDTGGYQFTPSEVEACLLDGIDGAAKAAKMQEDGESASRWALAAMQLAQAYNLLVGANANAIKTLGGQQQPVGAPVSPPNGHPVPGQG